MNERGQFELDRIRNEILRYIDDGTLTKDQGQKLIFNTLRNFPVTASNNEISYYPEQMLTKNDSAYSGIKPVIDENGMWVFPHHLDKDGNPVRLTPEASGAFERANKAYQQRFGKDIKVNSAFRSYKEQAELYELYKNRQAVAPPGKSKHNFGNALDVKDYKDARPFLENEGFIWRNHWNDPWHYDYNPHEK